MPGQPQLLAAAREYVVWRFVYSSTLIADHTLAQKVSLFREKRRFEKILLHIEGVSATILCPATFMETLLMPLRGRWPSCRDGNDEWPPLPRL